MLKNWKLGLSNQRTASAKVLLPVLRSRNVDALGKTRTLATLPKVRGREIYGETLQETSFICLPVHCT